MIYGRKGNTFIISLKKKKKIIYSYLNPLRFYTSSIFRTFAASYEGMDNYFVYPRENFNNYIYYVQNQF